MNTLRQFTRRLSVALLLAAMPALGLAQGDANIQHIRPFDQRGLNVFEAPKDDSTTFTNMHMSWGAAFTQDFQNLTHQNNASPNMVNGVNTNALIPISPGFTTAMANLYLEAQLAPGIRVELTTYLSTRHHNDAWVKGGYLQIDDSPLDIAALKELMKYTTIQVGEFEDDYGDEHFRRSDGGNTLDNPFVGNAIIDAFTTEIGAQVYVRNNGWLAMVGATGGQVHGDVTDPGQSQPAYLAKIGYDKQLDQDLRFRLTGSLYTNSKSPANTLIGGDRAGSHYFDVMESVTSTESNNAWSGTINPGMSNKMQAMAINPFIKYQGLELFGDAEQFKGNASTETTVRTWKQYDGQVVYRFLPKEQMYIAARYNTASGQLPGITNNVDVNRWSLGAGWFMTRNVLTKFEYADQTYNNFPLTDIRSGGQFKGFMVEAVIAY